MEEAEGSDPQCRPGAGFESGLEISSRHFEVAPYCVYPGNTLPGKWIDSNVDCRYVSDGPGHGPAWGCALLTGGVELVRKMVRKKRESALFERGPLCETEIVCGGLF